MAKYKMKKGSQEMFTTEANKTIVETFCKSILQDHDFSLVDKYMRDDFIQHNEDCQQGKAGFIEFFRETFKALPDFSSSVKKIIAEGDTVMMYSTTTATHSHEWLGNPATGNKLNYDAVDIFRLDDGKIAEHWDVADTLKLFSQLGKFKQY
jgi:steroid delta-isomerase-like uncharacterized protein